MDYCQLRRCNLSKKITEVQEKTPVPVIPPIIVSDSPKTPVDNRDARDKNNEIAFKAVEEWAKSQGFSVEKLAAINQRLALALVTESGGGYIYANSGAAYDSSKSTGWNKGVDKDVQDKVYAVLRRSLNIPYDKIGSNGRSTGMLQQISLESNQALYSKENTWGWGSMSDTMNPAKSALMFVKALNITDNPVYLGYKTLSPVIADVLRAQQPLFSEATSSNYNQVKLSWALGLALDPANYHTKGK